MDYPACRELEQRGGAAVAFAFAGHPLVSKNLSTCQIADSRANIPSALPTGSLQLFLICGQGSRRAHREVE